MALFKWVGIVLGSLLLLLVLLLVLLDWNVARDYVARQITQMTGRSFTIEGDLDIDWSLAPRLHVEQIRFGNASWSQAPDMLELAVLELRLDLLALLTGRLVIPELRLIKPRVVLEVSAEGQPNWAFMAEEGSGEGAALPTIERLLIEDGHVVYHDSSKAAGITATISPIHVEGDEDALNLQAKGTFQGEPIDLKAQGGSLPELLESVQHGRLWHLNAFQAALGQSDLAGQATLELGGTRPLLQATLTSNTLNTQQLQTVLGGDTTQVSNPQNTAAPAIDPQVLHALDANVTWQIQELVLPQGGALNEVTVHVELYAGHLRIDPLQIALGDGTAQVFVTVDASSRPIQGSLQVALEHVSLDQALTTFGMEAAKTGTLDGKLNLSLAPADDPETPLTTASLLQRLHVEPSTLSYRDPATQTALDVNIRPEHMDGKSMIKLVGQGRYQNQEVAFEAEADALARLASDPEQGYTIATEVESQGARTQLQLSLGDPSAPGGMTMQVAMQGENAAALSPLLGTSLPALSDYQLKGNIQRTEDAWKIEQMTVSAAGIELQGAIAITTSGQRPLIRVDLVVDELHIQQLREALADASAVGSEHANGSAAASQAPIDLAPLQAVDADVTIRARHIEAPEFPLDDVTIQANLRDGQLHIAPFELQIHDGQIAAEISLDATAQPLDGTIRSTIKQLDLGKVLQPFVGTGQAFGTLSGNLNLVATSVDPTQASTDVIMPFLGDLVIEESQLTYTDQANQIDIRARMATEAQGSRDQVVHIDAEGQYQQEPFVLRFRGDSLLNLRETDEPYALEATLNAVQTELHVAGHLIDPLTLRGVDMHLEVAGPDPERLSTLLGLPLPSMPPYQVQGHLLRQDQTWKFLDADGHVGDSDVKGDIQLVMSGERPYVRADLVSQNLDFDDLGPLIGKAPETGAGETASAPQVQEKAAEEASPTVLPKEPLKFDHLRRLDADIRLRGKHIETVLPLDDVTAKITIEGGRLIMEPLDVGVASGTVHTRLELDAGPQPAKANVDIEIKHVRLQDIVARFDIADESVGRMGGQAKVWFQGNSVADMLASADGGLLLLMSGGQFDDLLVELGGLDFGEALAALFGDREEKFAINCAFADVYMKQGVAQLKTFVVDTEDTLFLSEGTIDFNQESLDLVIDPKPKDLSLFSARAPLHIQGTLAEPRVRPGQSAIIRGAASLAMLPAAPLAALIPLLNPDDADGSGDPNQSPYCSNLVDAVNEAR